MRARVRAGLLVIAVMAGSAAVPGMLRAQAAMASTPPATVERDGSHDFDFLIGSWKFHLKRMVHPLSGSSEWIELDGRSTARFIWGGKANMDELTVDNPAEKQHIEGLTLRLYNPASHQWSLYWGTAAGGALGLPPTVGQFTNGVGQFFDQEEWHGRVILVRYEWSRITSTSAHFEQAFSTDGGKSWEVNWISDQVREKS